MIWETDVFLWFFLLVPVLVGAMIFVKRSRTKRVHALFSNDLYRELRQGHWSLGSGIQKTSFVVGLCFLLLALAGPKIGTEVREIKRRGVDMLIALDLSASMNAEDVRPSRLDKAKFEINRLIERLKGDRVGLVVFTGEAYLQSPMTLDYSALRLFLEIADTDQMPSSATDFESAMETSLEAFQSLEKNEGNENASQVLLIISDGEDHEQTFDESLQKLINNSILVYTVGIGTQQGTTIPLYDSNGAVLGYKRDQAGKVVTTRLQNEVLRDIANKANGAYYEISRGNEGIDAFLARIDELEKGEFSSQEYADFKNQYQWMGAIGLVCMLIGSIVPTYRRPDYD
ncbi:MAG: VWA domain-containing protein [Bacteroidota bacterium]